MGIYMDCGVGSDVTCSTGVCGCSGAGRVCVVGVGEQCGTSSVPGLVTEGWDGGVGEGFAMG